MKNNMRDCKHIMFAYFSAAALFGSFAVTLFGAKVLAQTASQGGAGGNPSCSLPAGQDVFGPAEQYVPVFNPATDKPTDSKFGVIYPPAAPYTHPPLADFSTAFLDDFTNRTYGVPFAKLKRITDPAIKAKFDAAAHVFAHASLHVPEDQVAGEYDVFNKEIAQGLSGDVLASGINIRALVFQKAGLSVGEALLNDIDVETRSPGRSTYGLDAEPNEATLRAYFHLFNELYKNNFPQYQFFFDWNKSIGFSNTGAAWTPQGYVFDWRRNGWTADGYPIWWSAGAANCAPSSSQNQTIPPLATTTVSTAAPQSPEEILNFQQSQNDALLQLLRQLQQASGQVGSVNTQSGTTVNNPNTNNAAANNSSFCHTFNANLSIDSSGDDVSALRAILIKEGFPATATGDFDEILASYVSGFQEKYANDVLTPAGLKNGTGYVGSRTRAKLNALYGCASSGSGSGQSLSPSSPLSQSLSLSNLQKVLKQISDKYVQLLNQSVALGQRSGGQGAGGGTGAAGGNSSSSTFTCPKTPSHFTAGFGGGAETMCVGDTISAHIPAGFKYLDTTYTGPELNYEFTVTNLEQGSGRIDRKYGFTCMPNDLSRTNSDHCVLSGVAATFNLAINGRSKGSVTDYFAPSGEYSDVPGPDVAYFLEVTGSKADRHELGTDANGRKYGDIVVWLARRKTCQAGDDGVVCSGPRTSPGSSIGSAGLPVNYFGYGVGFGSFDNSGNGGSQNAPATLSFSPNKQNYCVGDSVTWSVNSNPAGLNADLYRTHNGVQDIAGDKKFSVKTNYTSDPYAFNANDVGNWSLFYRVDTGNGSSVDTNTFTASVNSCSNTSAAQDQQCETLYGVACASLLHISDSYVRDRFDHFAGVGGVTTAEAHPGSTPHFFETIGLSPGEHIFNMARFSPASFRLSSAPSIADMSSLRAIFDGLNNNPYDPNPYHFDWTSGFGFRCDGLAWGPNGFDTNWQRGGHTSSGLPIWWSGGWGGNSCPIPAP